MPRKKKETKKVVEPPEGMKSFADTPDEDIVKDIKMFIDSGVISTTEAIPYTLAILYSSLNDEDKHKLAEGVCELSRKLDKTFMEAVANKEGTSVEFMFALIYMLSNMNATLMQDDAWVRLTGKGLLCRDKFLELSGKKQPNVTKIDDNRGYG
jgi:hypothetical protein